MCRLAIMNKSGFDMLEKKIGALKYFDFLEKQCGGHGNGLAISNGKRVILMKKGLEYTNKMIVDDILKMKNFKYIIYHTRVSSAGKISTPNCHPFLKNHMCLCMNGTETSFAMLGRAIDKTDTELILDYLLATNQSPDVLRSLTANYMGFNNGKAFFINNGGMRELEMIIEGNAFVVGSSFPNTIKSSTVDNRVWHEGEKIIVKEVYERMPKGITYGSYVNNVFVPITIKKEKPISVTSTIWDDVREGYENDKAKGFLLD